MASTISVCSLTTVPPASLHRRLHKDMEATHLRSRPLMDHPIQASNGSTILAAPSSRVIASTITFCSPTTGTLLVEQDAEQHRHRQYAPSIWGEFFLTHQPCTPAELQAMEEKQRVLKEAVRGIMLDIFASNDLRWKLDLVDELERLGLDYHYRKEIDELLHVVYNDNDRGSDDLYVTSLRFYLLRKHGYAVPSDVLVKFRDEQGNISSDDVHVLLMVYDAAHLRTRGEVILDNIITINKRRLQSLLKTGLESAQEEEVRCTLETPRFRRIERVEARRFISVYEKKASRNDTILELAKLDFNFLQVLYCNELKVLTEWWNDFQSRADMGFARDRLVEMNFWMMASVYEPYYSHSRIILTKLVLFEAFLDDVHDNYTTTEHSNMFVKAMERWNEKAAEELPEYWRSFYVSLLRDVDEIVEELKDQNNNNADEIRKLLIDLSRSAHGETTWRDACYVPSTIEEHLKISGPSVAAMQTIGLIFISLGNVTTREALNRTFTYQKPIRAFTLLCRIRNDIVSYEREQASEHITSTVEACMKQYGIIVEEAKEKLREMAEEAWKEIVEGSLNQELPMVLLEKLVSFSQAVDFIYKREDMFTDNIKLKDTLSAMYEKFV